jgi:ankyrin repeat protein
MFASNVEVAALLIQHGALVNERDKEGKTALMIAAICRKTDIVSLLMRT